MDVRAGIVEPRRRWSEHALTLVAITNFSILSQWKPMCNPPDGEGVFCLTGLQRLWLWNLRLASLVANLCSP